MTPVAANAAEIKRALGILVAPGETFEIRAIATTNYGRGEEILSGYFRGDAAPAVVTRADTRDVVGWYVTLNPVDQALHARRADRIAKVGKDSTTKDHHVTKRLRLLIDVDPARPTGISSSDAEHDAALGLIAEIANDLTERGWPEPFSADSGNGGHLIYGIDLPTEDAGLVERVLAAAATRWSRDVGGISLKVDVANANPSRITKLYGTPARKGDNVSERPHRVSRVLHAPESLSTVSREQLDAFAIEFAPVSESKTKKTPPKDRAAADTGTGSKAAKSSTATKKKTIDVAGWLARYGIVVKGSGAWVSKDGGDGTMYELAECPYSSEHGERGEAFVIQFASGAINAGCHHNGCKTAGWGWDWLRERFDPKRDFDRDEDGRIYSSQANVALALEKLGVCVRFDEFAERELIEGLDGFGPELDDPAMNRLRMRIDAEFSFRLGKEFFCDVVSDQARYHSFHPVRDYLDGLTWDGVKRLSGFLPEYAGAEDSEYTRAVGRLVLVAAVRRIRHPGCKFDEMMILESKQGTNKSTGLRVLAVRDEWFNDDLPLGDDTKRQMEAMAGKWINEAGELKGMGKGDVAALKSMLSRSTDRARLAYGRKTTVMLRQSVIIGTTNEVTGYLKDTSGNRRFWPVLVAGFDLDKLRRDRDQLWAEAVQAEAGGESIRLDPKLYKAAGEQQDERRVEDPFIMLLTQGLGALTGKLKITDCYRVVGIEPGDANQDQMTRLGAAVRELGWERKQRRFGADPEWAYVKGTPEQREVELEVTGQGRDVSVIPRNARNRGGV